MKNILKWKIFKFDFDKILRLTGYNIKTVEALMNKSKSSDNNDLQSDFSNRESKILIKIEN